MIPIKLTLSGFLSYRDPTEIDFTRFDLACISGANGAGKSSLLDAITFALFGQARKLDDALINAQSQSADVSLTFSYESNVYRVQRIKPREKATLLEFQIQSGDNRWKAMTERSLRETQARIHETLRMDYETFTNASFFLQGKADQFTQQKPSDRKRILSSILGLEIWESYRQRAAAKRKDLESEIETIQGRLQEIGTELGEEEQRKKHLKELEAQLASLSQTRAAQQTLFNEVRQRAAALDQQAALVATLAGQLARSRAQTNETAARQAERISEQRETASLIGRAKQIEAAYTAWQKSQAELANWDEVATRFNKQEKKRSSPLTAIEAEKARLQTELQGLREEGARLQNSQTEQKTLDKEFKTLQAKVKTLEVKVKIIPGLETELKTALAAQTKANAENSVLKEKMNELKGRIELMNKATGAFCPTCGTALTEEHRTEVIALLTKEGTEMGDRHRANVKRRTEITGSVESLQKSLEAAKLADEQLRQETRQADQVRLNLDELEKLTALWERERAPRLKELELKLQKEDFALEARSQLKQIDEELKTTGYDAAQHDAVRKQEMEARPAESEMRALEKAQAALKPLEREIKDLGKQVAAQENEIAEQEKIHAQAAEALAASQAGLPQVENLERQLLDVQEQENQLRQEVGAAQQLVSVLSDLRVRKKEFEAQREERAQSVAQYQSLERAFGKDGVPAMLIEQALPEIEVKANELLERLSSGDMHVSFVTQQAYKDKKREELRETLEIQISDSAGMRDYEMFSGGEAFRINFAIRLALSEVLTQRAGARLQTLVIDEGFGSQDEAGRQRLVEAISSVQADFAKILVITHIDELKDAFPNRIEVEKGQHGSTVKVI